MTPTGDANFRAAISRKVGRAGLRGAHSVHRRSGSCVGPSDDRRALCVIPLYLLAWLPSYSAKERP